LFELVERTEGNEGKCEDHIELYLKEIKCEAVYYSSSVLLWTQ